MPHSFNHNYDNHDRDNRDNHDNRDSYVSTSAAATRDIAAAITRKILSNGLTVPPVLLLNGDLGAGKTEFAKGVARELRITDYVTSPTFALVNDYGSMLHYDLYRIDTEAGYDDLYNIGFFDCLDREVAGGGYALTVIEWWKWDIHLMCGCAVFVVDIDKTSDTTRAVTFCRRL